MRKGEFATKKTRRDPFAVSEKSKGKKKEEPEPAQAERIQQVPGDASPSAAASPATLQSMPAKPSETGAGTIGVSTTVDPSAAPSRRKKRRKKKKAAQPSLPSGHAEEVIENGHGEARVESSTQAAVGNASDGEDSDDDYEEWSGFEGSPLPPARSPTQLGGPLVSPSMSVNFLSVDLLTRYDL